MARILCNVAGGGKPLKGNAETGDVLAGKTFSNKQSNALTGSMPNNGTNKNAVSVGGGSGSLWAYMPYGYYDNYNNSGNARIDITNDQAKTLANNAGVGYNKGVSDADGRVNTSSASYNSGYANGKAINRIVAANISGSHTFDVSRFNDKSAGAFVIALPQSSSKSWTLQDWGGSHTDTVYINISKSVSGNTLSTNVVTGLSGNNVPYSYAPVYSVYYIGKI